MYVSPLLREKQNGSIKVIRFTFKNLTYPRRSLWCGMSFDRSRDTHSKIKTPIKRMLPFKKKRACTLGPKIWHLRDCNGSCSLRGCMGELILYPVLSGLRNWNCAMFHFAVPLTVNELEKIQSLHSYQTTMDTNTSKYHKH